MLLSLAQIRYGISREDQEGVTLFQVELELNVKSFGSRTRGFSGMLNELCARELGVAIGLETQFIISKHHKYYFICNSMQ